MAEALAPAEPARRVRRDIAGPRFDAALTWGWVPFAAVAVVLSVQGASELLTVFALGVFGFSFSHQTLTVPLVYGDRRVMAAHRAVFLGAPVLLALGAWFLVGRAFVVVAVVAAAWNAQHTLMQRYGVIRIYDRLVGNDEPGPERAWLFTAFAAVIVVVAARGGSALGLDDLPFTGVNVVMLDWLDTAAPIARLAVVPMLLATAVVSVQLFRHARRRSVWNSRTTRYLLSTAALFAVGLVLPVPALLGFMGSHALEYVLIVDHTVQRRYPRRRSGVGHPTALGRLSSGPLGARGTLALWVGVVVAATQVMRLSVLDVYIVVSLTIGALHFVHDSLIWKLRVPSVRHDLGIGASS